MSKLGVCLVSLVVVGLPVVASETYFPAADGWQRATPEQVGWSSADLEKALDFAVARGSSDVVVVLGGRILAERSAEPGEPSAGYQNGLVGATSDQRPIEDVASLQKSVLSLLLGVAVDKGALEIDRPMSDYIGAGWSLASAEQEAAITVRHVLSMTSGLSTGREYEVPAGTRWQYNTNVYSRLVGVLEAAGAKSLAELTAKWLTDPLRMGDSGWRPRSWVRPGRDANRIGFATTARDLARVGLLVLARGAWQGQTVVSASWLDQSMRTSQPHNLSYGLLWWLNGQDSHRTARGELRQGSMVATAPPDLVSGLGALGRKLYIMPSLDLVVTRLGDNPGAGFDEELWRLLMVAAPTGAR